MNWNITNMWHSRWKLLSDALKYGGLCEKQHYSAQAAIAQMNYVCYLAQEWAGARK